MNSLIALLTLSALVVATSAAPNLTAETETNLQLSTQITENDSQDYTIFKNKNRTIMVVLGDVHIHNHSRPVDPVTSVQLNSALIVSSTEQASVGDILRVVTGSFGKVLISAPKNSTDLDAKLSEKGLFYIPLPEIYGLTPLTGYRLYFNLAQLKLAFEEHLRVGDYDGLREVIKVLDKQDDAVLKDSIKNLLQNEPQTLTVVAYSLWKAGAEDIVKKIMPKYFDDILRGEVVTIINVELPQALRLEDSVDPAGDSVVKARDSIKDSDRMPWKIFPVEEVSHGKLKNVFFKVESSVSKQCLKLAYSQDSSGDRQAFAAHASGCDATRTQWILEPTVEEEELVFYMINRHYKQPLKIPASIDANGERIVFGHNDLDLYPVYKDEPRFRWRIRSLP